MDASQYESLVRLLEEDKKIFLLGEGRSGLVAKMIAMRLMHAGKRVHVVGETTTPAISANDILLIVSGSGKSNQTAYVGEQADKTGAYVFLVTANKAALEMEWCAAGLHIPAATKHRLPEEPETIQPLGNQFDQAAHMILDAAIIDSLQDANDQQEMKENHSNLE